LAEPAQASEVQCSATNHLAVVTLGITSELGISVDRFNRQIARLAEGRDVAHPESRANLAAMSTSLQAAVDATLTVARQLEGLLDEDINQMPKSHETRQYTFVAPPLSEIGRQAFDEFAKLANSPKT
jgi:hypothetical protein